MSLVMMTCPLCNKNLSWDSKYNKETLMPIHYAETTGGVVVCDGQKQTRLGDAPSERKG